MALEAFTLPIIKSISVNVPNRNVVCLGYPDLLALEWEHIPDSSESAAIKDWHRWDGRVLDTDAFFASLHLQPIYIDRAQIRGTEIVADLNDCTLPDCGLLIDPGTSEHIFNIGHLFKEMARAVVTGGYILHTNPLNMANHGFWNFSPTAYLDFYQANGFQINFACRLSQTLSARCIETIKVEEFTKRYPAVENSSAFIVAKKVKDVPFSWPCQGKYRAFPMLRAS